MIKKILITWLAGCLLIGIGCGCGCGEKERIIYRHTKKVIQAEADRPAWQQHLAFWTPLVASTFMIVANFKTIFFTKWGS